MQWMEEIKLRIAEKNPELVEEEIEKLITDLGNNGSMKDIKLYHNAVVDNDMSVHLHWETGNAEPQGSKGTARLTPQPKWDGRRMTRISRMGQVGEGVQVS